MATDYNTGPSWTVLIPNYNGEDLLPACFPPTWDVVRAEQPEAEFVVVDDASTDGSPDWLVARYPAVRLLRQPRNQGYGPAVNRGIQEATGDLVLLLNSDVRLLPGALRGLSTYFEDPTTFAVTLTSVSESGAPREGANRLVLRGGLPHTLHTPRRPLTDARGRTLSSYPVGGHCVIRRRHFLELGGFDARFAPFYWEDAELGWRASRRGWVTYYEPAARVVHLARGAIRRSAVPDDIRRIKTRNRFLLLWVMDPRPRLLARIPLALRFAQAALTGDRLFFRAHAEARRRWAER